MRRRSLLQALPRTERDIVLALKLHGPTNISDLSERLQASTSSLRPHLGQLETDGIVRHSKRVRGPGRPQYMFTLTEEGEELFPTAVGMFGVSLVRFLARRSPDLLREFAVEAQERFLIAEAEAHEFAGLEFSEAIDEVQAALTAADYMPELSTLESEAEVTLYHCPLAAIVGEFPSLCDYERSVLQRMVEVAEVTRPVHRLDGELTCVYRFRELAEGELRPTGTDGLGSPSGPARLLF
jgi:predicted ArsR family transcriptional regulator